MRYFIDYPWHFHCDFLSYCLAISMDISLFIPITFIAIFIHIPCQYYWIFHCLSLPISLRFSLLILLDISFYISGTIFAISYLSLGDIILIPYFRVRVNFFFHCQAYFITILECFHNYFIKFFQSSLINCCVHFNALE
jgi:hypothetical protein